eukprot:1194016-Prorocentrum_minimum.AAC.5
MVVRDHILLWGYDGHIPINDGKSLVLPLQSVDFALPCAVPCRPAFSLDSLRGAFLTFVHSRARADSADGRSCRPGGFASHLARARPLSSAR